MRSFVRDTKAVYAPRMASVPQGVPGLPRPRQQFAVAEVKQSPQTGLRGAAITVAAVFVMLVDATAANVINTGLPHLQGLSAATPDEASWILISFNAAYYSTILFSPWLYARFGRKPLLLAGLLGFGLTSLMLAATRSLELVVVFRFFQGAFLGSVFVPAAVLLFTSLPLALLPLAPPFFATVVLGGSTLGGLIGGYVSDTYGGDAIYLPGAVATLIAAAMVYVAAPSLDTPQEDLRPDIIGYALSLTAFGAMQYLANEGERRDWFADQSIAVATAIVLLAVPALVVWELHATSSPHVNFRLIAQKRNLAVGSGVNLVLGIAGYSVLTFTLYLETSIAATATLAGEMIALRFVTYLVGIIAAFTLVKKRLLDVRALVCIAAVGSAVAFLGFARNMTSTADAGSFVATSLLFGLFFSMLSQPVPALVLGSLGLADLPAGLSIYKVSVPVGLMIGTGAFQTLLDHRSAVHLAELAGTITPAHVPVAEYLQGGGSIAALAALVNAQAQSLAFDDVMVGFAALVLLAIPIVFLA
ncbi:MAG: drug resistance transporter, drug:H+ antiporter-2 family protein, partial [Candidatus Eremiobacteraeota bacterium]|nr:drug resistance transporter, drug:H+ antiporter-2 family protein [Candidatus Eremiobacteraeota bacterium]